jgi:hypothetical protein
MAVGTWRVAIAESQLTYRRYAAGPRSAWTVVISSFPDHVANAAGSVIQRIVPAKRIPTGYVLSLKCISVPRVNLVAQAHEA